MTKKQKEINDIRVRLSDSTREKMGGFSECKTEINRLRLLGKRLHRQFEIQCNGTAFTSNSSQYADSDWWYKESEKHVKKSERIEYLSRSHIKGICDTFGLFYYIQEDPRGGTLYISETPLNDQNYYHGVFVA